MTAYLFWYIFNEGCKTEYVWIIANSEKEASDQFYDNFSDMYDYDTTPCGVTLEPNFENKHSPGDMLGGDAII